MTSETLKQLAKQLVKLAPELIPSLIELFKKSDTTMAEMLAEEEALVAAQRATIDALIEEKFPEE